MKGLFIGAGASYECGMPLVWEFTNILRSNVMKRLDSNLFNFKGELEFRNIFEQILCNPNLHYEQMIHELENIYIDRSKHSDLARTAALQLTECVQILLLEDQQLTTEFFSQRVKSYDGIKGLLRQNPCLHVFSLNHDVNFEEICKFHEIPCKDGFFDSPVERYAHIANFRSITASQLKNAEFNFYSPLEVGVNLLKLHGSLDMFAVEDKKLFLKCFPPDGSSIGEHVEEIRKIESHSIALSTTHRSRITMELEVLDNSGELQFLRRSLLSGGHKFDGIFDQIVPTAFLEEFKSRISYISELDVIGYGFGDIHINNIILDWLRRPDATMTIFDPHRKFIPDDFIRFSEQIDIEPKGLTKYLQAYEEKPPSPESVAMSEFLDFTRENLKKRRLSTWP